MTKRFMFGLGLCFGLSAGVFANAELGSDENSASSSSILDQLSVASSSTEINAPRTTVLKTFLSAQISVPANFSVITVSSSEELINALDIANKRGGRTAIFLEDGLYTLTSTLRVSADDILFLSRSKNPYNVIVKREGFFSAGRVQNLFEVRASGFVLDGITLADAPNHLIQIAAENNASNPVIRNCILQDSYEQLVKVSYDQESRPENISYNGVVEHCIFQYTAGLAPNYYTGGIDALGAKNWRVENNIFKDIASPSRHIAQHAVHFWVNASNNIVQNNIFIDNDRAIGFGMKQQKRETETLDYNSKGGVISGNIIYHSDNGDPFADTGIVLEASPETVIKGNYIFMRHGYPRAIEYRFEETQEVLIQNNRTNRPISARDNGRATLSGNDIQLDSLQFMTKLESAMKAQGILHLAQPLESGVYEDNE